MCCSKEENKVLILVATHNRGHLIHYTLDSILSQTYSNWECLVVDDNSTDNTHSVVKRYLKQDSRFFYFLKDEVKKGLSSSRNCGLRWAKKKKAGFIQFFDDDDIMHPQKLELQVWSLNANLKANFSLCGSKNFKSYQKINWKDFQVKRPSKKFSLGESYLVGDIKFVAQVPLFRYDYAIDFIFDEDLFYAEEWALFSTRFLLDNPEFQVVKEVLFYRRKHSNSITERDDRDFIKTKTQAIVQIKVFDFLTEKQIHTKTTLLYFYRQFLLYSYNSEKIKVIQELIKSDKTYKKVPYFRFRVSLLIHLILRKIILRVLNY